jgi:hypothetical protein
MDGLSYLVADILCWAFGISREELQSDYALISE